jgi:hypothetical protein
MLSKRCRAFIQSAIAIFMLSVPLAAQTNTSTIAGVVTDQSGAAVANAKVVATLLSTGQTRESQTNDAGEFVVPQLAPGSYRVAVTKTGFQTGVVEGLTLDIAQRATVNVPLKVGQISEQVTGGRRRSRD